MDFSWFGQIVLIGIVVFVAYNVWNPLGLLVGDSGNIFGLTVVMMSVLGIVYIFRPMLGTPSNSK